MKYLNFVLKINDILFIILLLFVFFIYLNPLNLLKKIFNTFKILLRHSKIFLIHIAILIIVLFLIFFLIFSILYSSNLILYYNSDFTFKILFAFVKVLIVCYIVIKLSNYFINKVNISKNNRESKVQYYYNDEPIENISEDKLERKKIIENVLTILDRIRNFAVVAIIGEWGCGKTSILKCVKNEILKNNKFNDKFIIVEYNPWYYNNSEIMIEEFYMAIRNAISKHYFFPLVSYYFYKYFTRLKVGISYLMFFEIQMENETILCLKQKIEKLLQITDKKIVVIIDDLDRLSEEDLLKILKLIRLNSDFKNLIYLLSIDIKRASKIISKEFERDYLNKIIQIQLKVPEVDKNILEKYFIENISNIMHIDNLDALKLQKLFSDNKLLGMSDILSKISNIREIKRYLNSLRADYDILKGEVNEFDLMLFEIIKLYYPDVYEHIYYVGPVWLVNNISNLDNFVSKICSNSKDQELIKKIITTLFDTHRAIDWKTISNTSSFEKYFILNTPVNDIPNKTVDLIIEYINKEDWHSIENELKLILEKKLLKKLLKIIEDRLEEIDREKIFSFAKELVKLSNNLSSKLNDDIKSFFGYILKVDHLDRNRRYDFLRYIIKEGNLYISCKILNKEKLIDNLITFDKFNELKDFLKKRLDEFIVQNKNVFNEIVPDKLGYIIFRWIKDFSANIRINTYVLDYIIKLFKQDFNNFKIFFNIYFENLIQNILQEDETLKAEAESSIENNIFLFDRISEIHKLLSENKLCNDKYILEYKKILERCLKKQIVIDTLYKFDIEKKNLDENNILNYIWEIYSNSFDKKEEITQIIENFKKDGFFLPSNYLNLKKIPYSNWWDKLLPMIRFILDETYNLFSSNKFDLEDKNKLKEELKNKFNNSDKCEEFFYVFDKMDWQFNFIAGIKKGKKEISDFWG